ncbi:uncharacterized, partial [Tachysurus ichikawai]
SCRLHPYFAFRHKLMTAQSLIPGVLWFFFTSTLPCGSGRRIRLTLTQTATALGDAHELITLPCYSSRLQKAVKAISTSQLPAPGLFLPLLSHLDRAERKHRGWRGMSHRPEPLQTPPERSYAKITIRNAYY